MSHSKKVKTHLHRRDAEIKFARDFRMQQTSVSKALIRHDRQVQYDTKLHGKVSALTRGRTTQMVMSQCAGDGNGLSVTRLNGWRH